MRIRSIEAKNFRTLEDFSLSFKSNYCAISGRNNAGKSALVKIIQHFFDDHDGPYLTSGPSSINFAKDCTQWSKATEMRISITVELSRKDDSEVFFVVEKYSDQKISSDDIQVELCHVFTNDRSITKCNVDGIEVDGQSASEILKKFRSASNLVVHNSTSPRRSLYYMGGTYTEVLEAHFSSQDRKRITDAENTLQSRVKQAAKQHKEELSSLLGRLNDRYQVELTTLDRHRSSTYPLEIKLTDRSVEVPLSDWGAGTQNRTRILMSVLDAVRIRSSATAEDRSTPVFIVEEPESFLHPSAQAEFGQVLNGLAEELEIQIIATTHSPYLLNQVDPAANILLERKFFRKLPRETQIIDTSGKDWMLPFAENLGVIPSEFDSWKSVFKTNANKVILVEGDIDKQYFEIFSKKYSKIYKIPDDVEVVAYGGKDALKNTSILKFMVSKFGKVFVTFDLDAASEVKPALERIGLVDSIDFFAIGNSKPGCDCIEGLLPTAIKQKVYADKHDLVTALTSQDGAIRKSAKNSLKAALLAEFEKARVEEKDLSSFSKMFSEIGKAFA